MSREVREIPFQQKRTQRGINAWLQTIKSKRHHRGNLLSLRTQNCAEYFPWKHFTKGKFFSQWDNFYFLSFDITNKNHSRISWCKFLRSFPFPSEHAHAFPKPQNVPLDSWKVISTKLLKIFGCKSEFRLFKVRKNYNFNELFLKVGIFPWISRMQFWQSCRDFFAQKPIFFSIFGKKRKFVKKWPLPKTSKGHKSWILTTQSTVCVATSNVVGCSIITFGSFLCGRKLETALTSASLTNVVV